MVPVTSGGWRMRTATALTALSSGPAAGELLGSSSPHGERARPVLDRGPELCGVAELDGAGAGWVAPGAQGAGRGAGSRRRGVGRAPGRGGLRMERGPGTPEPAARGRCRTRSRGEAFLGATGFDFHSVLWDLELRARTSPAAAPDWPDGSRPGRSASPTTGTWRSSACSTPPSPTTRRRSRWTSGLRSEPQRSCRGREEDLLVEDAGRRLIGFCRDRARRRRADGVGPAAPRSGRSGSGRTARARARPPAAALGVA